MQNISLRLTSGVDKIPYRPLRWISHVIDYQFSGLNPMGYHISNITFHVLTSILVYLTITSLVGNPRIALFAAFLFAVHPVHTDSVTYISGRRDILSTLFYILGFYLFLESRKRKRLKLLILSFAAYLLAISSKEMAATLPAIFFFHDIIHCLPDKGSFTKRLSAAFKKTISSYKYLYSFFFVTAILFTCYKVFIKSPSNKEGLYGGNLYVQLLTVCKILVYYIKLLLFPINLIADYSFNSFPLPRSLFELGTLFSLTALLTIAFLAVKLLSKNKIIAFSLIWFFVTLLPVCHIFPHHELLAEHYLYLPSFGFVLLTAIVFERLLTSTKWRNYIYISFVVVILLFSIRTFYRNYDWKNSFTIWKKTTKTVPNCVRALNNLGIEYYKRKKFPRAKALYQKVLSIQPAYEKAYYNLGNLYKEERQFDQALKIYEKAAQMDPGNYRYHNNLGNAYAMQRLYKKAIKEYNLTLKLKPRYASAYNNVGNVYRTLGKFDLAITSYQQAIEIQPSYADAHLNLANTYAYLKQYDKSIRTLKNYFRTNVYNPYTANNLGNLYTSAGQYDNAMKMYAHAIKILPTFPDPYLNLGNLYLEKLPDNAKALHYFEKYLELAPHRPSSDSVREKVRELEKEGVE